MICNVNEYEIYRRCTDRICGKTNIIKQVLSSGDKIKIRQCIEVLSLFDLRIKDYV